MRRLIRRWIARIGSNILKAIVFAVCSLPALAETAILECTADAGALGGQVVTRGREVKAPALLLLSFRSWNVTRWNVESAKLFVHVAHGDTPSAVEVAGIPQAWGEIQPPRLDIGKLHFVSRKATDEPERWLAVDVPAALVEDVAANRAHGFVLRFKSTKDLTIHTRESVTYSPYLIVTGTPR